MKITTPTQYLVAVGVVVFLTFMVLDVVFGSNPFNKGLLFPAGIIWSGIMLKLFYNRMKS